MIRGAVMYPTTPGARFDHEHGLDKHVPLVKAHMGDQCRDSIVDKGLAAGVPGSRPTDIVMGHLYCDSVEDFQAGFGPPASELMADVPNYTDLSPVLPISEVAVGYPGRCRNMRVGLKPGARHQRHLRHVDASSRFTIGAVCGTLRSPFPPRSPPCPPSPAASISRPSSGDA